MSCICRYYNACSPLWEGHFRGGEEGVWGQGQANGGDRGQGEAGCHSRVSLWREPGGNNVLAEASNASSDETEKMPPVSEKGGAAGLSGVLRKHSGTLTWVLRVPQQ